MNIFTIINFSLNFYFFSEEPELGVQRRLKKNTTMFIEMLDIFHMHSNVWYGKYSIYLISVDASDEKTLLYLLKPLEKNFSLK